MFKQRRSATLADGSAVFGAVFWCAYLLLDAISNGAMAGWIHRLLLLAPLVVVPLCLAIMLRVTDLSHSSLFGYAVWVQPLTAACLVPAFGLRHPPLWFLTEHTYLAVLLTIPWLLFCGFLALAAGVYVLREGIDRLSEAMCVLPVLFLQVGGFWLMIDQIGVRFMGITAPIRLLTGVHFHFTGFGALVLLAGVHELFYRNQQLHRAMLTALAAAGGMAGIPLVAIGFLGPALVKSTGVILLSVAMILGAVMLFQAGQHIEKRFYAGCVRFAAGCLVIGMMLATVFQLTLHIGNPLLSIPVMTVTHGVLNGIGFMIFGLIGVRAGLIKQQEGS
jgi:hypothetical protein